MTVYIEYVFIDNFIIDFLIFKTAFGLSDIPVPVKRLLFSAFLGAAFSVLYPLITENAFILAAVKIIFGLLLTFTACKFNSFKQYINFTLLFFAVTFAFGGAVWGLCCLLGIDPATNLSVGISLLPVYLLYRAVLNLARRIFRKRDASTFYADAEITFGVKSVRIKGLFDTGNALYDGLSPVIIVTKNAILSAIDEKTIRNAKRITVSTVAGMREKISVLPTAVVIYYGAERNIFNNVTVCLTSEKFDGYDAILHPSLMNAAENRPKKGENTDNERPYTKNKKIS